MKVTVMFGRTGVVVPCREGWTVKDLIQQATQRVRKLLEQEGDFLVRTHHLEYCDGGILDPDDILSDLVEDKDKLMAVYEQKEAQQRGVAGASPAPSPDLYQSELSVFQPIRGGEIEVNSSALKSSTPLLVRSSSDSMLSPPTDTEPPHPEDPNATGSSLVGESSGGLERSPSKHSFNSSMTRTVEISGEHGPLGIHVVPYCSSLSGRSLGLYIRGVEEESRSRREGLFEEEECIVKINHTHLMDKTFSQAQEVFRRAMRSPVVRLEVVSSSSRERYEKQLIGQLFAAPPDAEGGPSEPPPPVKTRPAFRPADHPAGRLPEEVGSPEPTGSKGRCESPLLRKSPALGNLVANKKGGKRLRIDLKKGVEGLGFTVVTRDSSVHGPGPILIKSILSRGAAVKDGRLQSGDRILEVNGVDMAGVGQEELVCMLRGTRQGQCVCLVVLRQDDMFLPREMKEDLELGPSRPPEEGKEQLMLEVALNDSGSAGLGVSLKGNKSRHTGADLGIFIKSIIHGGAAYKDGRLRVNDQLVGVNGETLLGRSNHVAMETLRRSMSQEGNLRGTIQLVVLRVQDQCSASSDRSFDSTHGPPGLANHSNGHKGLAAHVNGPAHPHVVSNNGLYGSDVTDGSYSYLDEEEDEEELSRREHDLTHDMDGHYRDRSLSPSLRGGGLSYPLPPLPAPPDGDPRPQRPQCQHVKASKSMDLGTSPAHSQHRLVADESNVGSLVSNQTAPSPQVELGPTLGLKKSSSLESLQTAMSEVNKKSELLPFHRPRPNMVRGRGCNESFRAAIDKSYDGPAEDEDDEGSDQSSGRDTPASSSSRHGAGEPTEESTPPSSKKEKNKKNKGKKKEKSKAKGKEKDRKKGGEEAEETEKKSKKKGFGLLRFGKKKEEKKGSKAALQQKKSEMLSQEELHIMKEEIERIEAKHPELRDPRARPGGPAGPRYQEVEDDEADPNYARINSFRDRGNAASSPASPSSSPPYPARPRERGRSPSPPPQLPAFPGNGSHGNEPATAPGGDPMDGLYAKVNKPRGGGPTAAPPPTPTQGGAADSDRIQLLRREYQQARREGMTPPYEDPDPRRRGLEDDTHRIPVRGVEHRTAPRYEEVERQYASLPRRGPLDSVDYPMQPWPGPCPGPPAPPPATQGYPHPGPGYPGPSLQPGQAYPGYPSGQPYAGPGDHRGLEPGYYPHQSPRHQPHPQALHPHPHPQQAPQHPQPQHPPRGPVRQDVPPSPPLRAQRYETMTRVPGGGGGAYRHPRDPFPDQYGYLGEGGKRQNQPNPRQKNPMTAAV